MLWILAGCVLIGALTAPYWLHRFVEWKRTNPGRHAAWHLESSRDDYEATTDVLPVVEYDEDDPTLERLAMAVRQWLACQ